MDEPDRRRIYHREHDDLEFGRALAFSDGVFAIALTLLVVDLVPRTEELLGREGLAAALEGVAPEVTSFFLSVLIIGYLWLGHHRLYAELRAVDRPLMALNALYLGLVAFLPLAQDLLGAFPGAPLAYVVLATCLAAILALEWMQRAYAVRSGLHVEAPGRSDDRERPR